MLKAEALRQVGLQDACTRLSPLAPFFIPSLRPAPAACPRAKKIYNPLQPSLLGNQEQNTTQAATLGVAKARSAVLDPPLPRTRHT
jgi:hypothetical protein